MAAEEEPERTPTEAEAKAPAAEKPPESPGSAPTPKKSAARVGRRTEGSTGPGRAVKKKEKSPAPKAPNRPTLDPELHRLLAERRIQDARRPLFVRQAAHRYYAIGRWNTWRRPRGLQSKQRRHYGYRPTVVSIGFGSPRRTRGLTPSGFDPVIVRTSREVEALDAARQAAIIARTVGTRQRLVLEEVARKRGVHVLNPLLRERGGS
jgi:large subunit ribosomal protein L32e